MSTLSLGGLAAALAAAEHRMVTAEKEGLEKAAGIVEKAAKDALGTYTFGWEPLKPETIARKTAGDSPLLESGAMRDSIEHRVEGRSAFVGTNDDKAVWQTLGTSRGIPPRPFMEPALHQNIEKVVEAVGGTIFTRAFGK